MILSRVNIRALGLIAFAGILAGCAASSPTIPSEQLGPETKPLASSGALLYTVHAKKGTQGDHGVLESYEYPKGKPVLSIALDGIGTGLCSDASGNVWVIVTNGKEHVAYEYAHGGKQPIAEIRIGHAGGLAGDCAVDPTTGDLAVLTGEYGGSGLHGEVAIWPPGGGAPSRYPIYFQTMACAYDASGNLFVDGYIGSTVAFELGELPKGGSSFEGIRLKKGSGFYPGGLAWDGQYLDIVTDGGGSKTALYRVDVSGSVGRVVDTIYPVGLYPMAMIAIDGSSVAGTGAPFAHVVSVWPYPQGGKATKQIAHYKSAAAGVAISDETASGSPAIRGCRVPRYYRFGGSCTSGALGSGVTAYRLGAYRGIRARFKIPPTNTHGRYTFTFADATGDGDIGAFRGNAFPLYPNPCGESSCPGTAFLYVGVRLAGPSALLTSGPNVFSYRTEAGYPGTTCGEAELMNDGKWYAFGETASPKGETLTFNSAIDYKIGAFTIAVYCQ